MANSMAARVSMGASNGLSGDEIAGLGEQGSVNTGALGGAPLEGQAVATSISGSSVVVNESARKVNAFDVMAAGSQRTSGGTVVTSNGGSAAGFSVSKILRALRDDGLLRRIKTNNNLFLRDIIPRDLDHIRGLPNGTLLRYCNTMDLVECLWLDVDERDEACSGDQVGSQKIFELMDVRAKMAIAFFNNEDEVKLGKPSSFTNVAAALAKTIDKDRQVQIRHFLWLWKPAWLEMTGQHDQLPTEYASRWGGDAKASETLGAFLERSYQKWSKTRKRKRAD